MFLEVSELPSFHSCASFSSSYILIFNFKAFLIDSCLNNFTLGATRTRVCLTSRPEKYFQNSIDQFSTSYAKPHT